jgi:hypothetical protein
VAALEQHGRGALRRRELDLRQHLLDRQGVRLGIARLAVEGAKLAVGDAHVRVVRVRVDHERDDFFWETRVPGFRGKRTELEQRRVGEEPAALGAVQALAVEDLVADRFDHRARHHAATPSRSQTRMTL